MEDRESVRHALPVNIPMRNDNGYVLIFVTRVYR